MTATNLMLCVCVCVRSSGDGQVDFNEFMTILGPKLLSSETREGFLGSTIDTIFWQVKTFCLLYHFSASRNEPWRRQND